MNGFSCTPNFSHLNLKNTSPKNTQKEYCVIPHSEYKVGMNVETVKNTKPFFEGTIVQCSNGIIIVQNNNEKRTFGASEIVVVK